MSNWKKLGRLRIPLTINWLKKGAVTNIQVQRGSPTCFAFGAIACLEGAYKITSGKLLKFSEQQIVDWFEKEEGTPELIFENLRKKIKGVSLLKDYPYTGRFGSYKLLNNQKLVDIKFRGYIQIPNDELALHIALANQPVVVSVVANKSFQCYEGGPFYIKRLMRRLGYEDINHTVALVGLVHIDNNEYWLLKNSYSKDWGDQGRMYLLKNNVYGKSECLIAEDAWIPLIEGLKPPNLSCALKAGLYSPQFYRSKKSMGRYYRDEIEDYEERDDESEKGRKVNLSNKKHMRKHKKLAMKDQREDVSDIKREMDQKLATTESEQVDFNFMLDSKYGISDESREGDHELEKATNKHSSTRQIPQLAKKLLLDTDYEDTRVARELKNNMIRCQEDEETDDNGSTRKLRKRNKGKKVKLVNRKPIKKCKKLAIRHLNREKCSKVISDFLKRLQVEVRRALPREDTRGNRDDGDYVGGGSKVLWRARVWWCWICECWFQWWRRSTGCGGGKGYGSGSGSGGGGSIGG